MNIPNEEYLGSIIKYYNGLNFKNKFNLSTEEYKYLPKKYKVSKLVPRNQRLCWKSDANTVSKNILNTNLCDDCYNLNVSKYYKKYKRFIPYNLPIIFKLYRKIV